MTAIRTIGIVGAGQMGNGIAHVCALAGFDVMLNDVSSERLEAGVKTIQRNMDRQVHRQMISSDARDAGMRPAPIAALGRRAWRALEAALAFDRDARTESVEEFVSRLVGRRQRAT